MDGIEHTVAANIRRLREERNASLSELARRSGVAKATLSSLEAGTGNPTIQTLSALANALGCSLGDLIERDGLQLLRSGEGIWVEGPATRGRLIARLFGSRGVDVHEVQLKPNVTHQDRPLPGTVEHVYVIEGVVQVAAAGAPVELHAGDIMRFPANEPYSITGDAPGAKALFFINSGDIGPREIAESGIGGAPRRAR